MNLIQNVAAFLMVNSMETLFAENMMILFQIYGI